MIVADTGPIIAFLQIGHLDLLRQVMGSVIIPTAVYEELTVQRENSQAEAVEQSPWIQRRTLTNRHLLTLFPSQLHLGEREAIVLAQELGAQLLIDERRGRKIAREQGLNVFGSLRVLAEAKRIGLVPSVKPFVKSLLAAGYWFDEKLVLFFLQEIGEANP